MLTLYLEEDPDLGQLAQLEQLLRADITVKFKEDVVELYQAGVARARLMCRPRSEPVWSGLTAFNEKEQRVLSWLEQGLTNREIGRMTGLAEKTVEKYVSRILRKMEVNSRGEVIRMMARSGWGPDFKVETGGNPSKNGKTEGKSP
jgi:DNA-binding NarL/FixJ family response regulator